MTLDDEQWRTLTGARVKVKVLQIPAGFDPHPWDAAIVCHDCGITLTAMGGSFEWVQNAYDEMAAEHRRRCPGDGA